MNPLSDRQQELITALKEITTYGSEQLSKIQISPRKTSVKKYTLFTTMIAVQSYTEAILKLMQPDSIYDKAAEVLMRSIIEAYINLDYIYSNRTKNATLFAITSEVERIDFAKKHQALWRKYPDWKLTFGKVQKPEDWDIVIDDKMKQIQYVEKKYNISVSKLPNLFDRAVAFDTKYKSNTKLSKNTLNRRLETRSHEKYYILFYRYFSWVAHLTAPGLERFFRVDKTGVIWLDIDGKPEDIERVIPVAYGLYMAILALYLRQFNIYDKVSFEGFKSMAKSMTNK